VKGYCDRIDVKHIQAFEKPFLAHVKSAHKKILDEIVNSGYVLMKAAESALHQIEVVEIYLL
jgi:F-type H+-transporting ATPase subunit alpha